MPSIKDSIIKTEMVDWRALQFLQDSDFKTTDKARMEKLKQSIKKHGFIMPFFVWSNKGTNYCVDGFHRKVDLEMLAEEGFNVPNELPAIFVDCKNKKDAVEKLLLFSSVYANITDEGLYKVQNDYGLDIPNLEGLIDLPDFPMEKFKKGYLEDGDDNLEHVEFYANPASEVTCPNCGHKFDPDA